MFFEVNLLTPSLALSPVLASISWSALTDRDCSRTKLQTQRSGGTYCKNKLNSARTDQQNRWNRMKTVLEHMFILIFESILNVYLCGFEVHAIFPVWKQYKSILHNLATQQFYFPWAVFLTVKWKFFWFKSKNFSPTYNCFPVS